MNVLPVINRELREQARQPFTYSLRVLGVLAMLGGTVYFVLELSLVRFRGALPNLGGLLFSFLQLALSAAIWILVPLGAADCISRERREGTLGLLFLTPLRALDIVVAKGLAHGLRAGTLWLAVLPVMMIPFLLGGVSWQRAVVSAELNFCSLCGALASALLASAISKSRLRAQAVAILFSTAAVMVNAMFIGLLIVRPAPAAMRSSLDYTWLSGLAVFWVGSGPLGQTQTRYLLWGVGLVGIGSLIMLVGVMWFAAGMMRRNWRDEPPSVRAQRVTQVFCSPIVGQSFLRRWMRRTLMRNPIGWLEQRTWSGRMVTWVWLGIIVGIYSAVFTQPNFFRSIGSFQSLMGWLLAGSMGASAAGSFRRERETGVLELLLVSPLTTGRIIGGRLLGLWGQFFPSVALLLACWVYLGTVFPEHSRWAAMGVRRAHVWDGAGDRPVFFVVVPEFTGGGVVDLGSRVAAPQVGGRIGVGLGGRVLDAGGGAILRVVGSVCDGRVAVGPGDGDSPDGGGSLCLLAASPAADTVVSAGANHGLI